MGKREVTIYTCDGCYASSTVPRNENAPGFTRITLPQAREHWLCPICFGAVEWVIRFQHITRPPRVYRNAKSRYGLRKEES